MEAIICHKPRENDSGPQGWKSSRFSLFQLCLNVRNQICVLITSVCNAAGCWGSHSQFLCQCAKTANIVKGKNSMEERESQKKKSGKKSNCAAQSSAALGDDSHIRYFLFQRVTDSINACVHTHTHTLKDELGCRPEPVTVSVGEPTSHLR